MKVLMSTSRLRNVWKIVMKSKSGKAPGIDGLVADIFKNEMSIRLLAEVFNSGMTNNIIPTDWSLGIISSIPKCSKSDPRVHLNYQRNESTLTCR